MAADGSLIFNTKIDQSGFEKGTRTISSGVNKIKGSLKSLAKTAAASMPFAKTGQIQKNIGGLSSSLKSLAAVAAAAFSVKQIVDFAKASKEAYNESVQAETKLATIMRQRMNASDEQIESIKEIAAEQQKLGVVEDDVALAGAQQVATFLTETDSIKTLLPAMNDLLAQQNGLNASSGDAVNIANLMGKVLQGQTSALKRVGISFSDAEEQVLKYGSESERAAMLAQVITNNVGHMNQALAQTDAGKQTQLANTMGDVKEQFGQAVISIESAFLPLLARVVDGFSKVASVAQSAALAIRSAFGIESDSNSATVAAATASSAAQAADSYEDISESAEQTQKTQERSLASFDKINKLSSNSGTSSAQGGSGGGGAGNSAAKLAAVKPAKKVASWADDLKKTIKNGDWEGIGKMLADKINTVVGKVKWDSIKQKVTKGARGIAEGINGFVKNLKWKNLGNTIGDGITTAFTAAYTFLKTTKWASIGSGFANFLNGLMERTDFSLIGATLGAKLNMLINLAWGFVSTFDFAGAGLGLAKLINGWFDEVDWDKLGDTLGGLVQGIITLAFNFVNSLDYRKMATDFATAFNKFIKRIDFRKLGQTVSKAFIGVWTFIGTALDEIDWKAIGESISEFINGIDWWGILKSMFGVIGTVIKKAPEFLLGVVEKLDFANAAGMFALLFAPKLAKKLLNKITCDDGVIGTLKKAGSSLASKVSESASEKAEGLGSLFNSNFAKGLTAATAVIGAAVGGWKLGTMIYNAAKPGIDKITDALTEAMDADKYIKNNENKEHQSNIDLVNSLKKKGAYWLTSSDANNRRVLDRAAEVLGQYNKYKGYGVTISDVLNETSRYLDAKSGKLTSTSNSYTPTTSERIQQAQINAEVEKIKKNWKGTIPNDVLKTIENIARANLGLPKLAKGTVIPANYGNFAAILGDNKREPEVVSPVSTIEAAVRKVLGEQRSKQPAIINISLDTRNGKRLLTKQVIDDINDIIDSTGVVPINV